MTQIWKFPIQTVGIQEIEMPDKAEILCVQVQHGNPYVWAKVDPSADKVKRKLMVFGTGHEIPQSGQVTVAPVYIGTYQLEGGRFVGHLFEDIN